MNGKMVVRGLTAGLAGLVTALAGMASATTTNYQWVQTVSTYGPGGTSTFNSAQSVTVDPSGNVWATDGMNSKVVKFDGSGNWLGTFGGPSVQTGADGLHSDASGNIRVASVEDVTEFSSAGAVLQQFSMRNFGTPSDVAVDPSGNFWVPYWSGPGYLDEFSGSGTAIGMYGRSVGG